MEEILVPHLHPVTPTLRQLFQEGIQTRHEVPPMLVTRRKEARKLENQHADVLLELLAWFEKRRGEQVRIQIIPILLSGLGSEPLEVGELLDLDVIRHLECEPKILRNLAHQSMQILMGRKLVVGRIHAIRLERLRILRQSIPLKPGSCKLPAIHIPLLIINLPDPPGLFP